MENTSLCESEDTSDFVGDASEESSDLICKGTNGPTDSILSGIYLVKKPLDLIYQPVDSGLYRCIDLVPCCLDSRP